MAPLVKVMEALREILAPAAPDHFAHLPSPTPESDDDDDDEDEDDERSSGGGNIDPEEDDGGYDDDDDEEEEPLRTRTPNPESIRRRALRKNS